MKPHSSTLLKRLALLAVEILLLLAILSLLLATWMPALVGARPGSGQ